MSAARRLHAKSWVENAGWEPLTTTPGVRSVVVEVKKAEKTKCVTPLSRKLHAGRVKCRS